MSGSAGADIGFAVIHRWRLHPGTESSFRAAWASMTHAIIAERGGLGSRLHRSDDGTWVAYAQWPSREAWARSAEQASANPDPDASSVMASAIAETCPATPLAVDCDALVHGD